MLPALFEERMKRLLGEEYEAFLEGYESDPVAGLRLNRLKLTGREWEALSPFVREPIPWIDNGYYSSASGQMSDEKKASPTRHPYYYAGLYYVQEPSAMTPANLLPVAPGDRVLDLCAAPGGKSTELAAKLAGKGVLVSNDISSTRAKALLKNLGVFGVRNAVIMSEPPNTLTKIFPGYFDRILVDAPCSGEGMFRKNEAACGEWSSENVELCAQRQDEILDCAAEMLCPGGRLVYSTCTFAPLENEGSISRFLKRHGDFSIVPPKKEELGLAGCDGAPEYAEEPVPGLEHTLRLWPQRVRGEGHFAALLQREGCMPKDIRGGNMEDMRDADCKNIPEELVSFLDENLLLPALGPEDGAPSQRMRRLAAAVGMGGSCRCIRFGDNVYLVPARLPSLKGLRVIRPGLHLGERRKKRFEPSHALAMALRPRNAAHVWDLASGDALTAAYLNGQTFPAEGEKGWYLICADGFGLGWGKLAGGVMKNHYPRGLRRNC